MQTFIALAALAATVLAVPFLSSTDPCPKGCNFVIQSPSLYLHGLTLAVSDSASGTEFRASDSEDGRLVTTSRVKGNGLALFTTEPAQLYGQYLDTLSVHTNNQWQRVLGLQSFMPGLLSLTEFSEPWLFDTKVVTAKKIEYNVFIVDAITGLLDVKDASNIPSRRWVAYQDDATQKLSYGLWDGFTRLPHEAIPITIKVVPL